MGLLNSDEDTNAAISNGLLNFVAMAGKKKPFMGLLAGLQGYEQTQASARDRALKIAMEERKMKLEEEFKRAQIGEYQAQAQQRQASMVDAQRSREQATKDDGLLRQQFSPLPGPTQDQSPLMPRFDPRSMLGGGASLPSVMQAMQLNSALQPEKAKTMTLSPGQQVFSEGGNRLFGVPDKPAEATTSVREYLYGKEDPEFNAWQLAQKRAGASSVSVNTGQKGFDNTLKLRGDFRAEPVYKAHQEMQSAYSQITQALGQKSPAGDLAGATKMMKLLDPGSVVRESELGMAMAASGALDRVMHYATNIVNGTKLTPTQRADFQRLSNSLYSESVKQYNGKRSEYQGIAERNGLSVPDVLGPQATGAGGKANGEWSITEVN